MIEARAALIFPSLGDGFSDIVAAAHFPQHTLRFRNQRWAERVGLGSLDDQAWTNHFARFSPLPGNLERPLALRYHGHQFRQYNPALGDGRGFLFAQLRDDADRVLDLGTKGSGTTPWSRGGDGRLTLKGGVREVLATEMLEALGVNTSKSFSLFETGEQLLRGDEPSPTRSSVLVRLGHSHLRFGTFQRLAYEQDTERLRLLVDHVATHYHPEAARGPGDIPTEILRQIVHKSATLCAQWMVSGFVHGVLNTDNMNINGESFDYGPWRFIPRYDPNFVAAYFDHGGLYAFGRQPGAVLWNLARLADALRSLTDAAGLATALREFEPTFVAAIQRAFVSRLGVKSCGAELDGALVDRAYALLSAGGDDALLYDRLFFDWYGGLASARRALEGVAKQHYQSHEFTAFRETLEVFGPIDEARLAHPYFAREAPCSMLIDEVESIWSAIAERDDWSAFEAKIVEIRALGAATS